MGRRPLKLIVMSAISVLVVVDAADQLAGSSP